MVWCVNGMLVPAMEDNGQFAHPNGPVALKVQSSPPENGEERGIDVKQIDGKERIQKKKKTRKKKKKKTSNKEYRRGKHGMI